MRSLQIVKALALQAMAVELSSGGDGNKSEDGDTEKLKSKAKTLNIAKGLKKVPQPVEMQGTKAQENVQVAENRDLERGKGGKAMTLESN